MRIFSGIVFAALFIVSFSSFSQSASSTYSFYGIGDLNDNSLAHNDAMGGLGIGMPSVYNINIKNPAWLPYNVMSSFNVGVKGEYRTYRSDAGSGSNGTGSIRYMVLSIPVMSGKWGSAVSLLPYSGVDYSLGSRGDVFNAPDGEQVVNLFTGSGGLSQLAWSNGFRLFNKTNVGIKAAYVFGSINKSTTNVVAQDSASANFFTEYQTEESYNDIVFSVSVGQKIKLKEEQFVNIGIIYDHFGELNGTLSTYLNRLSLDGASTLSSVQVDDEEPIKYGLPREIGTGISYERLDKYKIGLDVTLENWTVATNNSNAELKNTLSFVVGGEFTPDYRDVNSYFNRINYRFGVNYHQLPYVINGTDINEFGINFGASFPTASASTIDAAFKFGMRGTTENDLVSESFFQFVLGLTVNERWFIKRRYD